MFAGVQKHVGLQKMSKGGAEFGRKINPTLPPGFGNRLPQRIEKLGGRGRKQEAVLTMSTTTKRRREKAVAGLTNAPSIPMATATKAFADSIQKRDDRNSYLADFLVVMDRLMHVRSFSVRDVLHHSQYLDLPNAEVRFLFALWTTAMIQFGKLSQVNGPYDDPIFIIS